MRLSYLPLLVLALLASCKPTKNGRSDLSQTIEEVYNPSILGLQSLTVEINRNKGIWAESQSDYVQAFGDSAKAILADFDALSFRNSNDTLIINYALKEPIKKLKPAIVFVDNKSSEDSSKFKF